MVAQEPAERPREVEVDALLCPPASAALDHGHETTQLHADHLGSLTVATADGALVGKRAFLPTGEPRDDDFGFVDVYGFTQEGAQDETGSGLIHFKYRWLDPALGRWESPDPLFAAASAANLRRLGESTTAYAYVANGFGDHIDPTGLGLKSMIQAVKSFFTGGRSGGGSRGALDRLHAAAAQPASFHDHAPSHGGPGSGAQMGSAAAVRANVPAGAGAQMGSTCRRSSQRRGGGRRGCRRRRHLGSTADVMRQVGANRSGADHMGSLPDVMRQVASNRGAAGPMGSTADVMRQVWRRTAA